MAVNLTSQFQTLIDRDPQAQALIRSYQQAYASNGPAFVPSGSAGKSSGNPMTRAAFNNLTNYLRQAYGAQGWSGDYSINPKTGQVERAGYFSRNMDWIGPAAVGGLATAGSLGFLTGGGGAAASQFQQAGPTTTGLAGPSATSAVTSAIGPAASTLAATSGRNRLTSLLTDPDFWATIGGLGLGLYGAKTQANAADDANQLAREAADRQAEALQKALDLQKEMYEKDRLLQAGLYGQNRADLAPYRAAGQGSIGKLSYLLGVPGFESGPTTYQPGPDVNPFTQSMLTPTSVELSVPQTRSMAPAVQPDVVTGAPIMEQTAQTVRLQGPDGSVRDVPMNQAEFFLSRGARRIA